MHGLRRDDATAVPHRQHPGAPHRPGPRAVARAAGSAGAAARTDQMVGAHQSPQRGRRRHGRSLSPAGQWPGTAGRGGNALERVWHVRGSDAGGAAAAVARPAPRCDQRRRRRPADRRRPTAAHHGRRRCARRGRCSARTRDVAAGAGHGAPQRQGHRRRGLTLRHVGGGRLGVLARMRPAHRHRQPPGAAVPALALVPERPARGARRHRPDRDGAPAAGGRHRHRRRRWARAR